MMPGPKIFRLARGIACCVLAGVLLSGFRKILFPADFALAVYRFHLLPGPLVNMVALWLSWLEVVSALMLLLVPRYRVAALWIVLAMLLLFTGGIAINLLRGSAFGCGCFGSSSAEAPLGMLQLLRNGALVVLAACALFAEARSRDSS